MTILVLGGNSRLAAAFATRVAERKRLTLLLRRPPPGAIPGDVRVIDSYDRIPPDCFQGVTSIVNCVGRTTPESPTSPLRRVNVEIPAAVARQALDAGVRHFVQVSSLSVFGGAESIDEATPLKATADYGRSKIEAEVTLGAMRANGLEPALLRVPMIYGREMPTKLSQLARLMYRLGWFLGAASRPRRSFVHISNAAAAIEHIVDTQTTGVVYACDRELFEIGVLAEALARHRGRAVRIVRVADALLLPLALLSPGIHSSLYRPSIVAERVNLCQDIEIPVSLHQGLQEIIENIGH